MNDLIQYLIVGAAVLAALAYLLKRLRKTTAAGSGSACGCGGCSGGCQAAAGLSENHNQTNRGKK